MSIQVQCPNSKCRCDFGIKHTSCPKCGVPVKRAKKFRVQVVNPQGKRITKIVDGSITLARQVESKIKGEVAQKKHLGITKAPVISEVWEKYLEWAKINKKSWKDDKDRWEKHIAEHIQDKKMDRIFSSDIDKITEDMRSKKTPKGTDYAPATIKQVIVLIKRVFNWSIENSLYEGVNPANSIKFPKFYNQRTSCLTKGQLEKLFSVLESWQNKRASLIVKFALYTGFRLDEVLGLSWNQIDFENGFVYLPDPKGKPVKLPLNDDAEEILKSAKQLLPTKDCDLVFPNHKGQRRVSFNKIWQRIRDKAGLPNDFRFHDLRHTYASYVALSGEVDLYTLQKLLNHQSPQMTQRYAHLLDEALRKGANVAGKVLNGNSKTSEDS